MNAQIVTKHNHGSNIGEQVARDIVKKEVERAKQNSDKPVRMVLGNISNQLRCSESVAAELVASSSDAIRRKINRERLKDKCADQLPTCPEDFLNVPDEYAQINGKPFLQHAELVDGKPMLVFFSQNGVSQLNNSIVFGLVTATFRLSRINLLNCMLSLLLKMSMYSQLCMLFCLPSLPMFMKRCLSVFCQPYRLPHRS